MARRGRPPRTDPGDDVEDYAHLIDSLRIRGMMIRDGLKRIGDLERQRDLLISKLRRLSTENRTLRDQLKDQVRNHVNSPTEKPDG
jgi:regulator of replication initiation timing